MRHLIRLGLFLAPALTLAASEKARPLAPSYEKPLAVLKELAFTTQDEDRDDVHVSFEKVATLGTGKYAGGDLILSREHWAYGVCKGEGCAPVFHLRYIRIGHRLVFLSKISFTRNPAFFRQANFQGVYEGLNIERDDSTTIPELEYPKELRGKTPRQVVALLEEKDREMPANSRVAFRSRLGDVLLELPSKTRGELFGVNRPDGTELIYQYKPDLDLASVKWSADSPFSPGQRYVFDETEKYGVVGGGGAGIMSETKSKLLEGTQRVGETKFSEPIYAPTAEKDPRYIESYHKYETYQQHPGEDGWGYRFRGAAHGMSSVKDTYSDYRKAMPFFYWKDPFGSWWRFDNADLLPVYQAEPLIYLYPREARELSVRLSPPHGVDVSEPELGSGWQVLAHPDGKLENVDGRVYRYLFWEGDGEVLPPFEEGFVFQGRKAVGFFSKKLALLGLSPRERRDFLRVARRRFKPETFYLVRFLPDQAIEDMAPLDIAPKPDAVLRVMVDYLPLRYPISVKEQRLKKIDRPSNQFLAVEWGLVYR